MRLPFTSDDIEPNRLAEKEPPRPRTLRPNSGHRDRYLIDWTAANPNLPKAVPNCWERVKKYCKVKKPATIHQIVIGKTRSGLDLPSAQCPDLEIGEFIELPSRTAYVSGAAVNNSS